MNRQPWVYRPQSVRIPEDAGVKRDIAVDEITVGPRAGQPLGAGDRSRYDSDTLFYDMFFASGVLICIGPPFVNLGRPKAILCDGERLRFKKEERTPRHARLCIEIPAHKQDREHLDLQFRFPDFTVSASCDMQRARPPSLPRRDLCLVAIQKENPAQWLRDWVLWHYRAHGIRRAVIYDNGSRDFPELGGAFSDLGAELDVGLVHWPFPYGLAESHPNKFTQTGALNHFHLFFGGSFDWGVNLDIDEYLFADRGGGGVTVAERLAQAQRRRQPILYLEQRHFPREPVRAGRTPRFFHYRTHYSKKITVFFTACKYIFQSGAPHSCDVHRAWFRGSGDLRENAGRLLPVWRRLRAVFSKKGKRGLRWQLQPVLPPYFHTKRRTHRQKRFFFCHYRGLNTGWKEAGKNLGPYPGLGPEVSEIAPELLIEDRRMAEQAAELGFRDTEEESGDASDSPPAGPAPDA